MAFERNESAGYLVNQLARLFARELQDRIQPLGLTTGVFPALLLLWEKDGATQRELVEQLEIEQPTMANTLTRMERDGLIVRKKDPNDGRAQRIWLTEKARALHSPATAAAEGINSNALATLSKTERQAFFKILRKIIDGLKIATESP